MTSIHEHRHVVVTSIQRAPLVLVDELGAIGTSTVHEALGRRGYVGAHITPIQTDVRVAGCAVTVLTQPGDNGMVHAAVEQCQPGDFLVVASTAPSTHGLFGDLLAASLLARGVRGVVTDAAVRDTADLRQMGFPAWSQHVSCRGTVKKSPGWVNVPVILGEQVVHPGDVICADDDGVVVVPRLQAERALHQARERVEFERVTRDQLERGDMMLDTFGIREQLAAMGVEWVDALSL
jgi:4-hydroxy-4-methyl-2-oxoglutarate aldolase